MKNNTEKKKVKYNQIVGVKKDVYEKLKLLKYNISTPDNIMSYSKIISLLIDMSGEELRKLHSR